LSLVPLTPEVISRIERFLTRFGVVRMWAAEALPGNPFGIETRVFGQSVATKIHSPLLRGKNRILGFYPDDVALLPEMLDYFRRDGFRPSLGVPYGAMTQTLFRQLTEAGMWSGGSGTVPVATPQSAPELPEGVSIRLSDPSERDLYLSVFQKAFAGRSEEKPEYAPFQWAEDSLPGARRYIAEVDGIPAGMASFIVAEGIGFCGTAGVLPEYRGRGIQRALIQKRLADASGFGCDLIVAGGSLFSTTYRNFERAGMIRVPQGMGWADGAI